MGQITRELGAAGVRFAIATPHVIATDAGKMAFHNGGNAVDAALAAAAALAVVYPHMCSVGGDVFALLRHPNGVVTCVNGSGAAPLAVSAEELRRDHDSMPLGGPSTITVPGAVHAWGALAQLGGRMRLSQLLEPAITQAEEGCPVSRSLETALIATDAVVFEDPGMKAVFVRGGRVLGAGEALRQEELGRTLRLIAQNGPAALYGGAVGRQLVTGLRRLGSAMTVEDLQKHRSDVTAPLARSYQGWDILTAPPNSQGFALLEILAALESMGVQPDALGPEAPLIASVFREVSRDRDRELADPAVAHVRTQLLLSKRHVGALARRVLRSVAASSYPDHRSAATLPKMGDTVAVVTADCEGWGVSLIQSVFHPFGAGILERETGIVCHNRGACFSLDPASPNVLEGGKRPLHTLMPLMVLREGRLAFVGGTMGGRCQPQIHAQILGRILGGESDLSQALGAPRWVVGSLDAGGSEGVIFAEKTAAALVGPSMRTTGMPLSTLGDLSEDVGHAQYLGLGSDGSLTAASDPRADGSAAAE
jgi:gamma-glutamyltranspeptidase